MPKHGQLEPGALGAHKVRIRTDSVTVRKVHVTKEEYRFRLRSPRKYEKFRKTNFNGKLPKGVHVVRGQKRNGEWESQAIHFDKDKYTYLQSKKWIRKHKRLIEG